MSRTRSNGHSTWPPWSMSRAFIYQRTSATTKTVAALVARRAANRTLRELDQFDNRLLADIGLDRAALATLMRGFTKLA